jgi:hypothetical protein
MSTGDAIEPANAPLSRDDLVTLIARAHRASAYVESTAAGKSLAAQSKLPKVIAENLGAGFGQWDFFPEAAEIVDFALGYSPPATEEELWALARTWAADDAAARPTLLALVGREILQHELRRVDVPKLRELFDEFRPTRARELRASLGLEVAPLAAAATKAATKRSKPATPTSPTANAASAASAGETVPNDTAKPASPPAEKRAVPTRMPKPEFKRPAKAAPPADAKRFQHPKFGEGVLQSQDGVGPDAKLTIKFEAGSKTLLARYVTELTT